MNRYKKLVSNSIIFTIGNFGSKIISFILVPLYTFYLSTSEFGTADLVMTTATMLLPLVSLSISQAVLRFAMDDSEPVDQVLTNALIVLLKGLFVSSLILVILLFFNLPTNILVYTFATLGINAIQNVLAEYTRAIGKVKNYAVNGIVQTLVLGLSNIILIVKFNYGIDGYLVSILISSMISILYLSLRIRVWEHINYSHFDKTLTKRMLKFSIPLIPNNFMWWLINASNRYFIIFYRGVAENGLFSVANKVPSCCSSLQQFSANPGSFQQLMNINQVTGQNSTQKFTGFTSLPYWLGVRSCLLLSSLLCSNFLLRPITPLGSKYHSFCYRSCFLAYLDFWVLIM